MKNTLKIGKIGFDTAHWATKSEDEFVKEGLANGTHPLNLTDDAKKQWLKDAHAKIKTHAAAKDDKAAPVKDQAPVTSKEGTDAAPKEQVSK